MKHFNISFLSFILCAAGAGAAFPGVVIVKDASAKKTLAKRVEQQLSAQDTPWTHFDGTLPAKNCPLYASVKSGLEKYYAKTDFSDPGRQSGWYRAELFLKWLKRHEAVLKQETILIDKGNKTYSVPVCRALRKASYKEMFSPQEMQGMFGVWLGARYAAGMFAGENPVRFPSMRLSLETMGRAVVNSNGKQTRGYIEIHPDSYGLVPALNLGLHEGTHLLAWMKGGRNSLSEWGTYLATVHYALPVKADEKAQTYQGARSFTHNAAVRSVSCEQVFSEYAAYALGARLYPAVRGQNFFAFEQNIGEYKDVTLIRMLRDLAAVRKERFFIADSLSAWSGDETKVLGLLKNAFEDCFPIQEMTALADKAALSCGRNRVEIHWDDENFRWTAFSGFKGDAANLARSLAPRPLAGQVQQELESLASFLGPLLDEIPLKEVSWKHAGITDLKRFRSSAAYGRLCAGVRQYAWENPSGVPPVPNGYM